MNRHLILLSIGALLLAAFFLQSSFAQSAEPENENGNDTQLAASNQAGDLLYYDDFVTRKESKWYTFSDDNVSKFYKDGKYNILLKKNGWSAWSFANLDLQDMDVQDFVLEVDVSQMGGPDDNDFGVVARYGDADNFSLFLISGDGYFSYLRKENGSWVVPANWTRSEAINRGNAENRIGVMANGENLELYANNELLGQFKDDNPISGDIGFWVESFDEGGVHVSFDDLAIYDVAAP